MKLNLNLSIIGLLLMGVTAQADMITFKFDGNGGEGLLSTNVNGAVNGTPGTGGIGPGGITLDTDTNEISIDIRWGSGNGFTDLSSTVTNLHIHGPTANPAPGGFSDNAGVLAGLPGFGTSPSDGSFIGMVSLTQGAADDVLAGRSYINVHTSTNGGGEIRGHLVALPQTVTLLSEDFSDGDGGFTVTSENHDDPWAYDAGAGAWSTDGSANGAADEHTRLTSPELTVGEDGAFVVIFDHRYDIEGDDWDGAALFISVNGGPFDYVEGAKFTENGYNTGNLIGEHALVGLTAFGGISPGHADGTYITSTAGPFPFSSGDKIQFQFLMANDQGAVGTMTPNWEIDSVSVVSLSDTDSDGIPDFYEEANGLDPNDPNDAALDPDLDGSSNLKEFQNGTDPQDSDSDDDGLLDGVETGTGIFVDENDTGTNPKSADTDGDGLADGVEDPRESFVDADQPGTDPNKSDSDGDSFADLTEIDLGVDPTDATSVPQTGTIVIVGAVDEFFGPDDLNLDPSVVIAVDTFGDVDRLVNGVTFQADGPTNGAGTVTNGPVSVTTSAANQINDWAGAPAFTGADPTSATNLGEIMRDIRWEAAPAPLTVDISGLFPGTVYEVQLLFNEGADRDRHWDIGVEGELVVDNITSEGHADPGGTVWTPNNSFRYIAEFEAPADGILNIVMQQHIGGQAAMGADNNPILQAVIVRITDQRPFEITKLTYDGTGATIIWNSRPGASYALDFSTDLTEGSWIEIDDGIPSQGEETTFIDTATPPGQSTLFYRVRSSD